MTRRMPKRSVSAAANGAVSPNISTLIETASESATCTGLVGDAGRAGRSPSEYGTEWSE